MQYIAFCHVNAEHTSFTDTEPVLNSFLWWHTGRAWCSVLGGGVHEILLQCELLWAHNNSQCLSWCGPPAYWVKVPSLRVRMLLCWRIANILLIVSWSLARFPENFEILTAFKPSVEISGCNSNISMNKAWGYAQLQYTCKVFKPYNVPVCTQQIRLWFDFL